MALISNGTSHWKYVQQRQQQNLKHAEHTQYRIVRNNIFEWVKLMP